MHVDLGGYHVSDIRFTAAFDIDARKVGRDLSEAVFAEPNYHDLGRAPPGRRGSARHDPRRPRQVPLKVIPKADGPTADIAGILQDTNTHVVVNYLPVGSENATKWYVEQVLAPAARSSTACRSSSAASRTGRSASASALPIVGDDIKSQVGATIVHRQLARLMREREWLAHTSQLNFGGNTDFLNMLERERLESRRSPRPTP